ncbi:MAG: dTDP-4-dehydrorhamnose reductase [Bauldia litoralis]
MILIFGGGGQLAQEIVARSALAGVPAVAIRRDAADIADDRQVADTIRKFEPTTVVNAAAYTDFDRAETDSSAAMRANRDGPAVLAEHCRANGLPLIHFSTDYVFDGRKVGPYREDDPAVPLSVYGRSKLAGEEAVRARHADYLILRVSWVYGRYGENFLKTILRLGQERDSLNVVADQHGSPTASTDIADAVIRLIPVVEGGGAPFGTYHFAGTGETTWYMFAAAILEAAAELTGRTVTVRPIPGSEYPAAAERPANSVLDSGLFERTFGFRAKPWQESTRRVVAELLSEGEAR